MRLGASLTLIAIGAILAFAVADPVSGIDLRLIGWILMAVGVIGLILTMVFWGGTSGRRRERIVERDDVPTRRTYERDVDL